MIKQLELVLKKWDDHSAATVKAGAIEILLSAALEPEMPPISVGIVQRGSQGWEMNFNFTREEIVALHAFCALALALPSTDPAEPPDGAT